MLTRILIAAAALTPAPLLAQSLHDTHRQVSMPSGKSIALYRPIERSDCTTATSHHQSGKSALAAPQPEACSAFAKTTPRGAATELAEDE